MTNKNDCPIHTHDLSPWLATYTPEAAALTFVPPGLPHSGDTQYTSIEGKIKNNLCGEFCAAFLAKLWIGNMLWMWEEHAPTDYHRIIDNDRGTGLYSLRSMLDAVMMNYGDNVRFDTANRLSPAAFAEHLPAIVGTRIDGQRKVTPSKGTLHWVVACEIAPHGFGGWVRIYNPRYNRMEDVWLYDLAYLGKYIRTMLPVEADWDYERLVMPPGDMAELRRRLTKAEAMVSSQENLKRQFCMDWEGE